MGTISDPSIRETLLNIAQQIFPIGISTRANLPPDAANWPWRASGQALSLTALHTIERFELLIDGQPCDEMLRVRSNKIATAPLWLDLVLPRPADWRTQRGLDEAAVFAPVDSDNFVIATEDPKSKIKKPRARAEFYTACWPLLKAAQATCLFPDATSWLDFAKNLYGDALSAWPPTAATKSSDFIKRFAKDIAICLLDQENPLLPADKAGELWQRAVLLEIGEYRHRHNAYDPKQVQAAVEKFDATLTPLL